MLNNNISIVCLSKKDEFVHRYRNIKSVKDDGFKPNIVSRVCRGKQKTHKGYKFMFADGFVPSVDIKKYPIVCLNENFELVKCYKSFTNAEKDGFHHSLVKKVCNKEQRMTKGFFFMYSTEYNKRFVEDGERMPVQLLLNLI